LFQSRTLRAFCRCSDDRILGLLRTFGEDERAGMLTDAGAIEVTCEYCSRVYAVAPEAV